jgi:hypothetical protein
MTVMGQLPQGAPTSTAVGEIILYPLDCRIVGLCAKMNLVYTRYADDIAISGGCGRVRGLQHEFQRIITDEGWTLSAKEALFGPGQRQRFLQIIVNAKPNVDRSYYESLRWLLRRVASGRSQLTEERRVSLLGKIQWVELVNPDRGAALRQAFDLLTAAKDDMQSRDT